MTWLKKHRVLVCGILTPPAAVLLRHFVESTLPWQGIGSNWLFRISVSMAGMCVPIAITLALVIWEPKPLTRSAKVGLAFAMIAFANSWWPIHDIAMHLKQERNLGLHDVPAPPFEALDLDGKAFRLADYQGQVVVIYMWASWCRPCSHEMPVLDALYRRRKDQGLMVFGLSQEHISQQRRFLRRTPVSFPLLTLRGNIPDIYRDIARYPAVILIDRHGLLQPAPGPEQPFDKVVAAVDALLQSGS